MSVNMSGQLEMRLACGERKGRIRRGVLHLINLSS